MSNVYVSSLDVPRTARNKRIYARFEGNTNVVNNSSSVVNNNIIVSDDDTTIINNNVIINGNITADNLTPLKVDFTADASPSLEDYQTNYAPTYGEYPTLRLYTIDGSSNYILRNEQAYIEYSAGLISRISWDLSVAETGYILIVGNAPAAEPETIPTDYAHQQAVGTTDITGAGSEADMTNMSITFTPKGKYINVQFSAPFHTLAVSQTFTVYINIEGTNVRKSKINLYSNDQIIAFQHLASVTPGNEITVKIRWNAVANIQQLGSTGAERILTILDLA